MKWEGKQRRLRERLKLALPVRVRCRESADHEWVELTRLIEVTPFGARFSLTHPTERGRVLHMTLPMPRQLRCFDHIEEQYRVWALVRHVEPSTAPPVKGAPAGLRFDVGVAFIGKHAPVSYQKDPVTLYEVGSLSADSSMFAVYERARQQEAAAPRSTGTRLQLAIAVTLEVFDEKGEVVQREPAVTENVSLRGAAVMTSLAIARGRFVRVICDEPALLVIAAVRTTRLGADGIPRLHLEFVDQHWPLEGLSDED